MGLPISPGSIYNFNQQAFELLEQFELNVIGKLLASPVLHADETGINIGGKRLWLHCLSNERWTLFYAHGKRGTEAMNEKGVLPLFNGILCHDHWKPYYQYTGIYFKSQGRSKIKPARLVLFGLLNLLKTVD